MSLCHLSQPGSALYNLHIIYKMSHLAPDETNTRLFQIRASQNVLKSTLKKPQIGLICGKSDPLWAKCVLPVWTDRVIGDDHHVQHCVAEGILSVWICPVVQQEVIDVCVT